MQIWCDIYPWYYPSREVYEWRIIIDTTRNLFTVVDRNDNITRHSPTAVVYKDGLYIVSDIPTKSGKNIVFKVEPFRVIEIVEGGGWHKHVIWACGHKIAEKDYKKHWTTQKYQVLLPNLQQLPKIIRYAIITRDRIRTEYTKLI